MENMLEGKRHLKTKYRHGALVDDTGVIKNMIRISGTNVPIVPAGLFLIDLEDHPIPNDCIKPFWNSDKSSWTDTIPSDEKKVLLKQKIETKKMSIINNIKRTAKQKILSIASIEAQLNWYHDGKSEDPSIKQKIDHIKKIRDYSNAKEEELRKIKKIEKVDEFKFDFETLE